MKSDIVDIETLDGMSRDTIAVVGGKGVAFLSMKRGVVSCLCGGVEFEPKVVDNLARLYCLMCGKEIRDGLDDPADG